MIVFEFFSGLGGIHQGLVRQNILLSNIFPFDINPNANSTYQHNFNIKPADISLESFSVEDYENMCKKYLKSDKYDNIMWTMSPPCQPFTRQGNELGLEDNRTNGYQNLLEILEKTSYPPNFFFLENVKNFEVMIVI